MNQLNGRVRRGLAEAVGVPGVIGFLILALLILSQMFGTAA